MLLARSHWMTCVVQSLPSTATGYAGTNANIVCKSPCVVFESAYLEDQQGEVEQLARHLHLNLKPYVNNPVVQIWDLRAKRSVQTLEDQFQILSVCISDAGDQVFSSSIDNTVKVRRRPLPVAELLRHGALIHNLSTQTNTYLSRGRDPVHVTEHGAFRFVIPHRFQMRRG